MFREWIRIFQGCLIEKAAGENARLLKAYYDRCETVVGYGLRFSQNMSSSPGYTVVSPLHAAQTLRNFVAESSLLQSDEEYHGKFHDLLLLIKRKRFTE